MSDIAISIKNLSKVYKLYDQHIDRLKEALHPLKKKYYRQFYALKNVNLQIRKGEILGIIGRNGAGKSTLLKIITGILSPSIGYISVDGNISALLELGTGFNPELPGIENIYLNGTIKGFTRKEMSAKIDDILSFAEIGDFINQPLKTYSSGMKARLGFALAINMDPEILILDEVLSVGDELFKRKCYAKMEEFFESGCTVLYVSHSVTSVNQICTKAIFIDNGELILSGPPKFVTMYYQKFLYSRPEQQKNIRNEIIQLNKNEEKKKKFIENLEKGDKKNGKEVTRTNEIEEKRDEPRQKPFYLPNFKSKSVVEQKSFPVDITDIGIRTLEGKQVNALVMEENYIFSYKVHFNIYVENVFFAMALKSEKGINISSSYTRDTGMIETVKKGETYSLEWHFQCKLLPGNYFANAAVSKIASNHERVVLNRITDAIAFKVQEISVRNFFGLVRLIQDSKIKLLN